MAFNLVKCDFCGVCLEKCHFSKFTKKEAAEEIRKLIRNEPTRITDECVTCFACNEYCPTGANPFDLILRRVEERGYTCTPALRKIVEVTDTWQMSPNSVIRGRPDRPVMDVCTFYEWIPGFYEGQLFEGATFLIGGAFEGGIYWEHVGIESQFKNMLQTKADNITRVIGCRDVVILHDDCYAAFTTKAMEYGINIPWRPVHQAEYYRDYLKAHKDKIKKLNMKIAYQLPCASHFTTWENEWIDEVMELIGCERVKRTYDRDNQICCGSIVGPRQGPEASLKLRKANVEDAKKAGAEAFIVHCPMCAINMRNIANDAGMKPLMLGQLVSLGLGEELHGPPAGLGDDRGFILGATKILSGEAIQPPF